MTVLSDRNFTLKEMKKKSKYKDLEIEIQRMSYENRSDPVVVGVLGTIKKRMVGTIKKVSEAATGTEIQKMCMLGSPQIPREELSV